jgi:hypothetical protein
VRGSIESRAFKGGFQIGVFGGMGSGGGALRDKFCLDLLGIVCQGSDPSVGPGHFSAQS